MATGNCQDGAGACTMAADWSVGVPIASSDALVWQDDALDSVITIASLANSSTYGSLGAAIGTMTWMWISAIVVLLGAELNAEIQRKANAASSTS